MSTFQDKNIDPNNKNWFLFDAKDQTLGRLATQIAKVISGKHTPRFTRHVDTGDFAVVVNADKIKLTGNKWAGKKYYDHSGYVSGLKTKTATEMLAKHPEELLRRAVWGMIAGKGPLAKTQIKKLKLYTTADHPHKAQKIQVWTAPQMKIARPTPKKK